MALLDNLSRKATEVSARAIQKTKDFSDITRLNSQIVEEERQQKDLFCMIGKLYYSLHSAECEDDFKALINSIADSEQKVAEMRLQVQNLKGIQRCEKCGAEVEKGAAFCSSCGTPMPQQQKEATPENITVCGNCGATVKKGNQFCTSCGKPLEVFSSIVDETVESEVKCPICGESVENGSVFCTNCGTRIDEVNKEFSDLSKSE